MTKVTISVKSRSLEIIPMFSVESTVDYENVKDVLLRNIEELKKIVKVVTNEL